MLKILLVDDEREEREGIAYLIRRYQYPLAVSQAQNGAKALEYLKENPVDILFTDVKMPVMNGLDLAREVNLHYPEIRIIIFSAYGEFSFAKQALEANAVNYLLKPIEIDEFRKVIEQQIQGIEEEKVRREESRMAQRQNLDNVVCKVMTGAYVSQTERALLRQFAEKGRYRLIYMEFVDNFYEKWETLFTGLMQMYLGKDTEYFNLFLDEGCLLIRDKAFMDHDYLEGKLLKFSRDLVASTKSDLFFIVSRCIESVEEFERESEKIRAIQRDVFGFGEQIVWTGEAMTQDIYAGEIETARRQLMLAIDANHVELIERYEMQLVEAVMHNSKVSRIYVQNLFYTILQAFYNKNPGIVGEKVLASAELIFRSRNAREIVETFCENFRNMMDSVPRQSDCSDEIAKIRNLVKKEYMNDISLGYVAEKVNLAPAYVSYIFKKETGQTLIKYITQVRMEKAKLLLGENLKIVQIARACGYEHPSYFNRAFKNYYGVTPSQYKEGGAK